MSRDYSEQYPYGYYKGGGWDIDTSDKTQREGDSGHIPGRFQWEETVDVSADDDDDDGNDDNNDDDADNDGNDDNDNGNE